MDPEAKSAALNLLKGAEFSAGGAVVANLALEGLFLWSINPTNLVYSLMIVLQNWGLVAFVVLWLGLPALTFAGARSIRRSATSGDWARARRWLAPVVVTGYLSWIVPGYFLHETLNLLNSWTAVEPNPTMARSVP